MILRAFSGVSPQITASLVNATTTHTSAAIGCANNTWFTPENIKQTDFSKASSGNITINGGKVIAKNTSNNFDPMGGAGIGGAFGYPAGNITINGGIVEAEGGPRAAGIGGGGLSQQGGTIKITGGTVTATTKYEDPDNYLHEYRAAGIGAGGMNKWGESWRLGEAGNVIIDGGTISAMIQAQPKNSDGQDLFLNMLTLSKENSNNKLVDHGYLNKIEMISGINDQNKGYGIKDVYSNNDSKLLFYLPSTQIYEFQGLKLAVDQIPYYNMFDRPNDQKIAKNMLPQSEINIRIQPQLDYADQDTLNLNDLYVDLVYRNAFNEFEVVVIGVLYPDFELERINSKFLDGSSANNRSVLTLLNHQGKAVDLVWYNLSTLTDPLSITATATFINKNEIYAQKQFKTVGALGDDWPIDPVGDGFLGWFSSKSGSGSKYNNASVLNSNIILYSRWQDNTVNPIEPPVDPPTPEPPAPTRAPVLPTQQQTTTQIGQTTQEQTEVTTAQTTEVESTEQTTAFSTEKAPTDLLKSENNETNEQRRNHTLAQIKELGTTILRIGENEIPLYVNSELFVWSLFNLISVIIGFALSIFSSTTMILDHKNKLKINPTNHALNIIGIILGLIMIIVFLVVSDLSGVLVIFDSWSILFGISLLGEIALLIAVLIRKDRAPKENKE